MAKVADMTIDELKQFILDLIEEQRLKGLFGTLEDDEIDLGIEDEPDTRSLEEVFASVERNRWTPPPGSPTPSEMIREDRDTH
jgi:hypothetical protein